MLGTVRNQATKAATLLRRTEFALKGIWRAGNSNSRSSLEVGDDLLWFEQDLWRRGFSSAEAVTHAAEGRNDDINTAINGDFNNKDANVQGNVSSFVEDRDAARRAYSELVSTILKQAAAYQHEEYSEEAQQPFEFEGLHLLEEQQNMVRDTGLPDEDTPESSLPTHIRRSLAAIRYHQSLMDGTPRGRKLQKNWQRQITLETRAVDAAIARYRREAESAMKRGTGATLPPARKLLVQWFKPLAEAIQEEQYKIANGAPGIDRSVYGPYLLQLDPEQLAVITMHAAMNCFMSPENEGDAVGARPGATRMTKLATAIGKAVEAQHHISELETVIHKQNMKVKEDWFLQTI